MLVVQKCYLNHVSDFVWFADGVPITFSNKKGGRALIGAGALKGVNTVYVNVVVSLWICTCHLFQMVYYSFVHVVMSGDSVPRT